MFGCPAVEDAQVLRKINSSGRYRPSAAIPSQPHLVMAVTGDQKFSCCDKERDLPRKIRNQSPAVATSTADFIVESLR